MNLILDKHNNTDYVNVCDVPYPSLPGKACRRHRITEIGTYTPFLNLALVLEFFLLGGSSVRRLPVNFECNPALRKEPYSIR